MDDVTGIVWRPASEDDVDALFALNAQWEEESDLPYRTSRSELEHEFAQPQTELRRDTLVAIAPDGRFVASAWITIKSRPGFKHRAFLATSVLRGYEGLEVDAIRWAERSVRERFMTFDDDLPRVIRSFAESTSTDRIARYEECGFAIVRHFVDMARPLDAPVAAVSAPNGIDVVTWDDRLVRSAFEAEVEAFADHWGSIPPSWEEWQHRLTWPGTRLDLSVIAVVRDEVVSLCLNGVYPQDWQLRGRREGWIDTLGTRRAWRRRGLASALINESLARFAAVGLEYAAIGVDAASPTGAFGLYERLGFVEQSRSLSMMKEIAVD